MTAVRRLTVLVLAVGLVGVSLGGCEWPEGTRFVDEVFTDVDVTTGILYRRTTTHDGQPIGLKLDIYQPRGDTRAERPVVFWMFGGGWVSGNRDQLADYARDSARRGYVSVTIDYRIRPGGLDGDLVGAAFDAYDDAVAAAQWLESHASAYRIDRDAIVAGGVSAGAINALHLLYLPGTRGPAASPIDGAISISGLSFVAPPSGRPPAVMHHGTADTTVPYAAAQSTCDRARAAGSSCELITYEGGGHLIAATDRDLIQDRSADRIFEQVLWPLGYRIEGAAAAA